MRQVCSALVIGIVLACIGCGDDDAAPVDAAGDASDSAVAPGPMPPAAPMSPMLGPCPSGWREVPLDDDTVLCDPWPESGPVGCADDEAHFPGEPGCARVGSACPSGQWPDDLPATGPVLYVRAGAPSGGSGTRADPYGLIADAVAAASDGTVVALGTGTFDEYVNLVTSVTLWGACTAQTTITTTTPGAAARTIRMDAPDATVRNLRVTGIANGITGASGPGNVEDVIVDGARGVGVSSQADLNVRGTVIRDIVEEPGALPGIALGMVGDGVLDLSRAVLVRSLDVGFVCGSTGASRAADVAVLDGMGVGMGIADGGQLVLERAYIGGNVHTGIALGDPRTEFSGTDLVVADTAYGGPVAAGWGISAIQGAEVEVSRTFLVRNGEDAIFAASDATTVRLADVVAADGQVNSTGTFGRGIGVQAGASLEAERMIVTRARDVGIFGGSDARLQLTDMQIRETGPDGAGEFGRGLHIQQNVMAAVTRALFDGNTEHGAVASFRSTLTLADVVVRDTASEPASGVFGRGLSAGEDGTIVLERGLIERNREAGLNAQGARAVIRATDVVVRDTLETACATSTCAGAGAGIGVAALGTGAVELSRFTITLNALAGLQLARGGVADLSDGEVSENPVGVNLQTSGFDVARLQAGVAYRDNGVSFDSTELPVPNPAVDVAEAP